MVACAISLYGCTGCCSCHAILTNGCIKLVVLVANSCTGCSIVVYWFHVVVAYGYLLVPVVGKGCTG